jgi:hypothetical protein
MIDSTTIAQLEPSVQFEVRKALSTLWAAEILTQQIAANNERLLEGSDTEPIGQLAERIRKTRNTNHHLLSLHHLGAECNKEINS